MHRFLRPLGPCWFGLIVAVLLAGCGNRAGSRNPDRPFGSTALVTVVTPQVNDGNTTAIPESAAAEKTASIDGLVDLFRVGNRHALHRR